MRDAFRVALVADGENAALTDRLSALADAAGWTPWTIRVQPGGVLPERSAHPVRDETVALLSSARHRPALTLRAVRPGTGPPQRLLRARAAAFSPHLLALPSASVASVWLRLAAHTGARTLVTVASDEAQGALGTRARHAEVWAGADRLVVQSASLAALLYEQNVPPGRVAIVPSSADPRLLSRRPTRREPMEPMRLLSVGALSWMHGYEHAFAAVRMLGEIGVGCGYRIVGVGPHEDALAFALTEFGLQESVELVAPGTRPLSEELAWADAVVSPGIARPSERAIISAQAAGVPLIRARLPEDDDEPEGALVVPPLDAAALVDAIASLRADSHLQARLVAAGRRLALSAAAPEREAQSLHELQGELLMAR